MSEDEAKITSEEEQEEEPETKTPKGKRGRPAKGAAKTPTPKKGGKVDEKTEEAAAKKLDGAKRGRGRPKKIGGTKKDKKPSVPGRGRGRPKTKA